MVSKPLLEWDEDEFEEKFYEMGYKPRFIGKPVTLENMIGNNRYVLGIEGLSSNSRDEIQKYLKEVKADGAVVLDVQMHGTLFPRDPSKSYGDIIIAPYKLTRLKD